MTKRTSKESEAYDQALAGFSAAVDTFGKRDFARAKEQFEAVIASLNDEPVLLERSRMYRAVCVRRLAPANQPGSTQDDLYLRAVVKSNAGAPGEAIKLLDQALQQNPNSAKLLFARASAWALSSNAEAAVRDLRQAISIDPTIRFHAVNDPDFEPIREEPGFIDIIEPTPTGA